MIRLSDLSPFWKGLLGAIFGCGLTLLAWHAYLDHVTLHNIVNALVQQQNAQRPAAPRPTEP